MYPLFLLGCGCVGKGAETRDQFLNKCLPGGAKFLVQPALGERGCGWSTRYHTSSHRAPTFGIATVVATCGNHPFPRLKGANLLQVPLADYRVIGLNAVWKKTANERIREAPMEAFSLKSRRDFADVVTGGQRDGACREQLPDARKSVVPQNFGNQADDLAMRCNS